MNKKEKNPIKIAKKINPRDFVYLGIFFLLIIIILITFIYSTRLIINNINKIFKQNDQTEIQVLDLDRYLLVEKKLNLPKNITPKSTEVNN